MAREGKAEYLSVEIGMARREMNLRNHQSIIYRIEGKGKQLGNSQFWISNKGFEENILPAVKEEASIQS